MRAPEAGRTSSPPDATAAAPASTVALRLLESAPDAILGVDPDGVIRLANRASAVLFGYEPDELLGHPIELLLPEALRETHVGHRRAFAERSSARPMGADLDLAAVRKDGSTFPVEISLAPVDGPGGPLVTAIVRDATERRRTEHALQVSRRRLAEAEQLARVGSWEWDIAANAVTWSDQLYRIYGLEPQSLEPSYEKFLAFVHDDDRESVNARNQKAFADHQPFEDVKRVVRADGTEILMRTQGDVVCDEHGAPIRMIGVCEDVTAEKRAQETRAILSSIVQSSGDAIHALDRVGRVTGWNPAAESLFGYGADEMIGRPADRLLPPAEAGREHQAFARVLDGGAAERFESRRVRRDGTQVDVSLTMSPIINDGVVTGVSVITRDVGERKRLERQLRYLADHDPLTGLLNGRRFEEEIASRIADTARYGGHGAVLALGIDGLKDINDSHGHSAGDALIRSIAERLRGRLRDTDVLARIGGDEMGVLLSRSTPEDARTLAKALLDAVRDHRLLLEGQVVRTTTSIGVAMFDGEKPAASDVLAAAERGLYAAKDAGRDRIMTAPATDADTPGRGWALRLREAIDADGLMLQYQPILDLAAGTVHRYEALVRLRGPEGPIPPLAFIGTAERLGLMHDIDAWVLREAIGVLASRPDIALEVNVSGRSVGDHDLPQIVARELRRTGVDPSRLIIEITETAAIANMDDARRFADEILELGCAFALDDFGAGFGSFAYLKHLPADLLKIDGEFIKAPRSHADELIVQSIVAIAKAMGKQTVAECVGDQETVDALRAMGVDYAQGFFIGRPASLDEIEAAAV
ncbi:EAL domain-containing protein [Paraconexibacter sp.]|uniref:sensor domain-containing protein n=1 Tax=Paraconexibacter sp. TaxID=2949640 RepID=UPI0035659B38